MSTILVTGANGFVGGHIVPALLSAGHRVVALVRNRAAGETVLGRLAAADRSNVELREGDVTQPLTLLPALAGVDAVVHLVAIPRDLNGGADLARINTEGTRAVLAAMTSAGVRRLVAVDRSNVELREGDVTQPLTLVPALAGVDAVVHLVAIPRDLNGGADLARINTEGTRAVLAAMTTAGVRRLVHMGALGVVDDPRLHYASSKARAEAAVRESGLDWTVLKPSLQFGPGDGFFNIIAGLVRISPGIVPVPGDGQSRFQPIFVGDVAAIAVRSLADPETIGQAFELGGPRYWTYREITQEVLGALGKRRAIVPVPLPLIRLVARTAEFVHLPFPVASDQLRQLSLDNVGPLDLIPSRFGFEPRPMSGALGYLRLRRRDQLAAGA